MIENNKIKIPNKQDSAKFQKKRYAITGKIKMIEESFKNFLDYVLIDGKRINSNEINKLDFDFSEHSVGFVFNTSISNADFMFNGCNDLIEIDLSELNCFLNLKLQKDYFPL